MRAPTKQNAKTLFDLTGKTAIVTGSGRGLGKAIVRGLAEAGANVTVAGRSADVVFETTQALRDDGFQAHAIVFDAEKRADCKRLVDETIARFSRLDIMVVNHAVCRFAPAESMEPDVWRSIIDINLTSAFDCAQFAGRRMIEQGNGGSIIFTSSNGSLQAFEGLSSYGASKAGLDHLARHMAFEWGKYGIRVNTINPGYTTSQMHNSGQTYDRSQMIAQIEDRTPLRRRCEPEELVGPVVFLASAASSFITGHVMPIDGGWGTT
jgi:gluconate 5-dehydrogenase